ncbi:MAG: hypothetical protein A6F71_05145 [Cycloclasticus sp. symbiont of Poecilosclerida sp. M]|nr:MAG: hypothetical protein A6F71_05145 [Cycloclasticus sp. symbiont of Poecilosclerida sp. M]
MNLDDFYTYKDNAVSFTREQASAFAKDVAGDFNPIHDVDAKRFCVPGDLLFSVVATKLGVSKSMRFVFQSMVNESTQVQIPNALASESDFEVCDQNEKTLMRIERSDASTSNQEFIVGLIERYVEFSGHTFPDILTPLMKSKGVMINPARPLVIYTNMEIHIDDFANGEMSLDFASASLDVDEKKGRVELKFDVEVDGTTIGHGIKNMVLGGLRAYEQSVIDTLVLEYNETKAGYLSA